MVDQSELAFRQLARRHGATGAYTPMLHARLFLEAPGYRAEHFTTCAQDRPLLAQFCANDPDVLLGAAQLVAPFVDGVDLNLGCPQRIARRGKYGARRRRSCGPAGWARGPAPERHRPGCERRVAWRRCGLPSAAVRPPHPRRRRPGSFLMDDLPLVERLVSRLAAELAVPVTVKIRRFDCVQRTVAYAQTLERAGASLLAIHGRTREQKRASEVRAEWDYIRAVKQVGAGPQPGGGGGWKWRRTLVAWRRALGSASHAQAALPHSPRPAIARHSPAPHRRLPGLRPLPPLRRCASPCWATATSARWPTATR